MEIEYPFNKGRFVSAEGGITSEVPPAPGSRFPGIAGVILAGGESRRMGCPKALLPYRGGYLIEAIYRQLSKLFAEVIVVTNSPEQYAFLPCRKVSDLYPGRGVLAGIQSGLHHSGFPRIFVTACDMPYLNSGLIRRLAALMGDNAALVPASDGGLEPLHAFYDKAALPAIDEALASGVQRIVELFDRFPVRIVPAAEVAILDPTFASFRNINTPDDYCRLRDGERDVTPPAEDQRTRPVAGEPSPPDVMNSSVVEPGRG